MASHSTGVNPKSESPRQEASRSTQPQKIINIATGFNTFDPYYPNRSDLNVAAASNAASGLMPSDVRGGYSSDFVNKHRCFEMVGNSEFDYDRGLPSDRVKRLKPRIPFAIECYDQNNLEGFSKEKLLFANKKNRNVFPEEPECEEFSFPIKTLKERPAEPEIVPPVADLDESVLTGKDTPVELRTEVESITSAVVSASPNPESVVTKTRNEAKTIPTAEIVKSDLVESDVPEKTPGENRSDAETTSPATVHEPVEPVASDKATEGEPNTEMQSIPATTVPREVESIATEKDKESPSDTETASPATVHEPVVKDKATEVEPNIEMQSIPSTTVPREVESIATEKDQESPSDTETASPATVHEPVVKDKATEVEPNIEMQNIPSTTVPREVESIATEKDQESPSDVETASPATDRSEDPVDNEKEVQKKVSTEMKRNLAILSEDLQSIQSRVESLSEDHDSRRSQIKSLSEDLDSSRSRVDALSEDHESSRSRIKSVAEDLESSRSLIKLVIEQFNSIQPPTIKASESESIEQIGPELRNEESILAVTSTESKLVESVVRNTETKDEPLTEAGSISSAMVREVNSASGKEPREKFPAETKSVSSDGIAETDEVESVASLDKTREDPPSEVEDISSVKILEESVSEEAQEKPSQ